MYLSTTTAKGKKYVYLIKGVGTKDNEYGDLVCIKEYLYGFGRNDKAIKKMREWKDHFEMFPSKLKELGCTEENLLDWIRTLETGITKTGRNFSAAI